MNGPQIIVISIEVLMSAMCGVGLHTKHPPSRVSFGVRRSRQKVDPCERHPQDVIQSTGRFLKIATYLVK